MDQLTEEIENATDLSKAEAIALMNSGVRMTHHYFSPNEWVTIDGDKYLLEDGVRCPAYEFWQWRDGEGWYTGWYVHKSNNDE